MIFLENSELIKVMFVAKRSKISAICNLEKPVCF